MKVFVCALAALALFALGEAKAGCQKVAGVYSQFISPVHIQTGVIQHVNHGYGFHGYGHGFDVHNQVIVKPFAIPVAIVPNTFYQVLPELAYARVNQELADAAAEKAAKKAVEEIIQQLRAPDKQGFSAPASSDKPVEKSPQSNALGKDKVLATVKSMVDAKCLKCHGQGDDFDLSDLSKLSRQDRLEVVHRIMTDDAKLKMPKGGGSVTAQELDAAHAFVLEAPKEKKSSQKEEAKAEKTIQPANKE